jgi:signal transduction histidine kinase
VIVVNQEDFDQLDVDEIWIDNIVRYEHQRLFVRYNDVTDRIHLIDVTPAIQRQAALIRLSLIVLILAAVFAYILSQRLTKKALRDVYTIADFVHRQDINTLDQTLHLDHLPEDDEIQIIATAINSTHRTLYDQVGQIKRFVSNLSHEIKTPLMASRSHAELALKKHNYEDGLRATLGEIDQLNRLVGVMTMLHQADHGTLADDTITLEPLVATIRDQVA